MSGPIWVTFCQKSESLRFGLPGGQSVRTLHESLLHPLAPLHLPSEAKIQIMTDDLINSLFPVDSLYIPLKGGLGAGRSSLIRLWEASWRLRWPLPNFTGLPLKGYIGNPPEIMNYLNNRSEFGFWPRMGDGRVPGGAKDSHGVYEHFAHQASQI